MQTELLSVSKIFTENLFRIPDYQRGYSWTEKQLRDFWADVEQLEEGRNHYTGVLTLEDVPPTTYSRWDDDLWIIRSRGYRPYYVVDGQQRLTTIIIALQAILERFSPSDMLNYTLVEDIRRKFLFDSKDRGISRSYIFGYEKDNPSYEFLKTKIFLEQSDSHSTAEETIYTYNLWVAKEFFKQKLSDFSMPELEKFYTRVTQHLLFNIYTISEDIDVFVAFETMNNRGKPLSHLELLKNRLIFLSTKFKVEVEEKTKLRITINESWKTVYHFLGKNKERPLDDDHFLVTHFFLRFGPDLIAGNDDEEGEIVGTWRYRRDDYYKEYLLNEIFTVKRLNQPDEAKKDSLSVRELYEYARHIKKVVEVFYHVFNPADFSCTDRERVALERLRRLGLDRSLTLVVAVYLKQSSAAKRADFLELLEQVEFVDQISPYISGIERVDYEKQAIQYIAAVIEFSDILALLKEHREQCFKRINFNRVFTEWGKGKGYFGWRGARYFLFEYEQDLHARSKTKRQKLCWEEFSKEDYSHDYYTLEHIYPQKVSHECWKSPFAQYSIQQRNVLKNSVGNLVPLSKPKNSSLRNKCFDEKKGDQENKIGYVYGCYSENEIAQELHWTAREILVRGIRLLDFMERRWGVPLGDKRAKVKALGLDFVLQKEKGISL